MVQILCILQTTELVGKLSDKGVNIVASPMEDKCPH